MKRVWVKLWIEMLNDPKMLILPDWEWRRFVEMLMLAGMGGDDGALPTVPDMAIILRKDEKKLSQDLTALSKIGVVREAKSGQWVVTKFKERQYSDSTDRMRKKRERERHSDANCSSASSSVSESLEEGMQGEKPSKPPLTPEQVQEVIADARKSVDYTLENFSKVSYSNRHKIPEVFLPYADVFHDLTGMTPRPSVRNDWLSEFGEWQSAGVRPEDVRAAHKRLEEIHFSVTSPRSLTKTAIAIRSKATVVHAGGSETEVDKFKKLIGANNG